jgi:hypothetical protein
LCKRLVTTMGFHQWITDSSPERSYPARCLKVRVWAVRSASSRTPRKGKSESTQIAQTRTKGHRVLRVQSKRSQKQAVSLECLTLHTSENGRLVAICRTLDSGRVHLTKFERTTLESFLLISTSYPGSDPVLPLPFSRPSNELRLTITESFCSATETV